MRNITIVSGSTNSGKTFHALTCLTTYHYAHPSDRCVYAGPLRILAKEKHHELTQLISDTVIGLATGEEKQDTDSMVLSCTVEAAPVNGGFLIIDEAHWASDKQRGGHWTNLILNADYQNIHILTNPDYVPVIRNILPPQDVVKIIELSRLTPLYYEPPILLEDIGSNSVIVFFSKKKVINTTNRLISLGVNAGSLYADMPVKVRSTQINRFINGELDVLVSTDVIGHGINLPVSTIVFGETRKFDGEVMRDLFLWEASQITGRAGRYGKTTHGTVTSLKPGRNLNTSFVKKTRDAAIGDTRIDIPGHAIIFPTWNSLKGETLNTLTELMNALNKWENHVHDNCYLVNLVSSDVKNKLTWIMNQTHHPRILEDVWELTTLPINVESPIFMLLYECLLTGDTIDLVNFYESRINPFMFTSRTRTTTLENAWKCLTDIRVCLGFIHSIIPGTFNPSVLNIVDQVLAELVLIKIFLNEKTSLPVCESCGDSCIPDFTLCPPCFWETKIPG